MKSTRTKKSLTCLVVAALLSGPMSHLSAGFMEKFKKSKTINLAPFADQTIGLLGKLDYGLQRDKAVRLRKYADFSNPDPDLAHLRKLENHLTNFLKVILRYSLKIWELSSTNMTEEEKCQAYATYLRELAAAIMQMDDFEKVISMTREEREEGFTYIASQKKFLKALEAAGPFMDQFDNITRHVIQETSQTSVKVANNLGRKIDEENTHLRMTYKKVQTLKRHYLEFLGLNLAYVNREPGALEKMQKSPILKRRDFARFKPLSSKNAGAMALEVQKKLGQLIKFMADLEPDYESYFADHEELQKLVAVQNLQVKEASVAIIVWSRAHRTMASGKLLPAQWFDFTDTKALLGMASKAVF